MQKFWDNGEVAVALMDGLMDWIVVEKSNILENQNSSLCSGNTCGAQINAGAYKELLQVEEKIKSLYSAMKSE